MKNTSERKILHIDRVNPMPLWNFKQEDDGVLLLEIYKGGQALDVTGQAITLGVKNSKGQLIEHNTGVVINKSSVDITLSNSIFAVKGKLECDLILKDSQGQMSTAAFYLLVGQKVLGEENILSTNIIPTIDKIATDLETRGNKLIDDVTKDYCTLQKVIIDENAAADLQNQINGVNSSLETKAKQIDLEVERKRIDVFTKLQEGSTTGDAELIDGRVGADGKTYDNIGGAIRGQFENITKEIKHTVDLDYTSNIVKGKYINSTGTEVALSDYNYVKMLYVYGLYSVTLKNIATSGNACVVAYDKGKTLIGKINKSSWTPSTETIILSENVYYISISYSINYTLTVAGRGIKYSVIENKNKIDSAINDVFNFELPTSLTYRRINTLGKIVSSSTDSKVMAYIPIKPNTIITLENIMTLNVNGYCYAYYDKDFKFVGVGTDKNWETVTITETTPSNAYFVSITYKNGNTPKIYTKDLTVNKNINDYSLTNFKNTTIIWVDDDSDKTGIEYVYSACRNKGVNATLACIAKNVEDDVALKSRLLEMEENGLEIALHCYTHDNSIWNDNNTDKSSIINQFTKGYRALKDFQNHKHIVTANGIASNVVKTVSKRFSPCLVSAWEGVNKKEWGDNAKYNLGRYWMTNHTLDEFKLVIDNLRPRNDLLILATHSAPSVAPWDSVKIEAMLQYIKDNGLEIVTLSEGINYFYS